MTLLAFDTATRATTVALCQAGRPPLEARDDPAPGSRPRHATHLLTLAAQLLAEASLDWADLRRLAVGVGPGTFTGLRIGLATARALAQARQLPLVAVSTAASLALGAWSQARDGDLVAAVIDARRGEVFAAAWRVGPGDRDQAARRLTEPAAALLTPTALTPSALGATLSQLGGPTLAVGDGAVAFRETLERGGALVAGDSSELHKVSARHHCQLAACLPDRVPEQVRPEYLRPPDAELPRRLTKR